MTDRNDMLRELERLNPVPDHEAIYVEADDATRLRTAVDAKRNPKGVSVVRPARFDRRNVAVASLAFAAVVVFGAVAMLVFDGGEPEEVALVSTTEATTPTTGPILATTAAPDLADPTTTEPTPTTTVPPETSTTTAASVLDRSFLSDPATGPATAPIIGDGPATCDNDEEIILYDGPPAILRPSLVYEGGIGPFLCLAGFDTGQPVEVTVTHGGDLARTTTVSTGRDLAGAGLEFAHFVYVWRSLPGDPVGQYTITARQGGTTATATFEVIAPREPGISIEPTGATAGDVVQIVLFGMPPNADIELNFYRQQVAWRDAGFPPDLDPIGQVNVTTDGEGWAVLSIDTGFDDPKVGYLVEPTSPQLFTGCICPFAFGVFELLPPG